MVAPAIGHADRPAHVPAECVFDYDYYHPEGLDEGDVYTALKRLHRAGHDILWTPRNGGHWIVTRAEDIRWVRDEAVVFSRTEFVLPAGSMDALMPPVNVDPPYHARFRAVLNPAYTPARMKLLAQDARDIATGLIEELRPAGCCEVQNDLARMMSLLVSLKMLNVPEERYGEIIPVALTSVHDTDPEARASASAIVARFVGEMLDLREAEPGEDVFSRIVAFRSNPRFQREEEVMGMALVAFSGALDSVPNLMAFALWHLAQHPEARRRLIAEPDLVPRAAEEYFRRFGVAQTGRILTQDVARKGVSMKKGDCLLVVDPLAGIDDRVWTNAELVDFDRDPRGHDTFGNGPHRCLGEHLARMEVIVLIEEWLKRIPEFRLDPAVPAVTRAGIVVGMPQLGLCWDAAEPSR